MIRMAASNIRPTPFRISEAPGRTHFQAAIWGGPSRPHQLQGSATAVPPQGSGRPDAVYFIEEITDGASSDRPAAVQKCETRASASIAFSHPTCETVRGEARRPSRLRTSGSINQPQGTAPPDLATQAPSGPMVPAALLGAWKQDTHQFNVQSASVVRSLTKTRLPEMAGCAQVACSATL